LMGALGSGGLELQTAAPEGMCHPDLCLQTKGDVHVLRCCD